jgi:WD repeat-containing protein 68
LGIGSDEFGLPSLRPVADAAHPYPATKIAFQPSSLDDSQNSGSSFKSQGKIRKSTSQIWSDSEERARSAAIDAHTPRYPDRELLATTADCLRIWECLRIDDNGPNTDTGDNGQKRLPFELREKSVLAHSKNTTTSPAPLTSFSWNVPSPNLIVTSSIDTTCTIWDLPTRTALTQLIAHDREVFDVDWCPGSADVFASVGADGSVRVFDLRSLDHSTIIYETGNPGPMSTGSGGNGDTSRPSSGMSQDNLATPLLRIAFNPWDANYLATFHLDSECVQILDVRAPGSPILELRGHKAGINAVAWGPPGTGYGGGSSKGMICSAADDSQCLVYDLASATLRSASAQGRRSRNGAGPSPAPSSSTDGNIRPNVGAEVPILAYTAEEMVNNVSWLRLPTLRGAGASSATAKGASVVNEWNTSSNGRAGSGPSGPDIDWLALVSGRTVRALRV